MSYQVFARKYRPRTFDDVLGQDHVVRTLRNAIAQNRLAHAYLFVGPRGTGKTSTARIFAKALNCPGGPKADFDPDDPVCIEIAEGRSLDVLEIDGASNNGVEQVRELRENVKFAPSSGKFRIYYIDEVHMLSGAAFNALLKTLEEPPPHVKFIFATTEAHKVLPTIISRCQRFDLRRIPDRIIAEHLLHIAGKEGVDLDPLAAYAIAKGAEGGMRDAQSMLDQLVAFCGERITEQEVLDIFGFTSLETLSGVVDDLLARDTAAVLARIHQQNDAGKDLGKLLGDLLGYLRSLLVEKVAPEADSPESLAPELAEALARQAASISTDRLLALIERFAEAEGPMKWAPNKKLHFEIAAIKAIQSLSEVSISDVINALAGTSPLPTAPSPAEGSGTAKSPPPARPTPARVNGGAEAPTEPPRENATGQVPRPSEPERKPSESTSAPSPSDPAGDTKSGSLADEDLWPAVLTEIQRSKPLLAPWAACGVFCETKGRNVIIGFHPDDAHKREHLERPSARDTVRTILSDLAGRPLEVRFEVREDVERPSPDLGIDDGTDEEIEAADEASAPQGTDTGDELRATESAPARSPAAGHEAAPPSRDEAPPEAGPEFYEDTLIDDAMNLFKARRIES